MAAIDRHIVVRSAAQVQRAEVSASASGELLVATPWHVLALLHDHLPIPVPENTGFCVKPRLHSVNARILIEDRLIISRTDHVDISSIIIAIHRNEIVLKRLATPMHVTKAALCQVERPILIDLVEALVDIIAISDLHRGPVVELKQILPTLRAPDVKALVRFWVD